MGKIFAVAALALAAFTTSAAAEAAVTEGRSVGTCSDNVLVCATMKDGSSNPTSECKARLAGAVRVLPGDCYDAD